MKHPEPAQALTQTFDATPILDTAPVRKRRRNIDLRPREYLTLPELEQLITAARKRRHGQRDATMILMAFRHALRVSELVTLRWSDVDFAGSRLHVRRLKGSIDGVHPLEGDEMRALRRLKPHGEFVFMSERGAPITPSGFRKLLTRIAADAGLTALAVHPHALRHSTGFALINKGVDLRTLQGFMGHSNVSNTVRYAALDANRFRGLWRR